MFDILSKPILFTHSATSAIRNTHILANEDDMVRVRATDGVEAYTLPYFFSEGTRDAAMVEALTMMGVVWDKQFGCTLTYYTDSYGVWCVECNEGMHSGDEGGHVCGNERCKNFDPDKLPVWVKELHNVA